MTTPNLNGWEKLICPYFTLTCRRVLARYMGDNGFTERSVDEIGSVMYSRFDVFLEVSYELDMVPQTLRMNVGIGDKIYDDGGHPCCVPYWYLLPADSWANTAKGTSFRSAAELEVLLSRMREDFLELYAKPLWLNVDRLDKAIANFRAEFSC